MYPQTEGATDDRRQVDVDEHPHDDQLDAQRDERPYGDTSAGQHDYGTGEAADPDRTHGEPASDQDRTAEHGEPAADREERSEPAWEHERVSEPAGGHGSAGYAESEFGQRPGDDLRDESAAASTDDAVRDEPVVASTDDAVRDEPAAASTDEAPADRPAAEAPVGAYTGPAERPVQPADVWQLFAAEDADNLRSRWSELQGSFVDDPKHALDQAEQLVDEVVQTVTDRFNERRNELQGHGSADTEDLRLAVIRYRVFFRQLLGS